MCLATAVTGGFTAFSPLKSAGGSSGSFGGFAATHGGMEMMWVGNRLQSLWENRRDVVERAQWDCKVFPTKSCFSFPQTAWVTVSEPPVCLWKHHTSRLHSCKIHFASVLCVWSGLWGGGGGGFAPLLTQFVPRHTAQQISPLWCCSLVGAAIVSKVPVKRERWEVKLSSFSPKTMDYKLRIIDCINLI